MLSLEECRGYAGLSEDEVAIIAEHEHIPAIVAVELGSQLLESPRGLYRLHGIFLDSLELAVRQGRREREKHIDAVYAQFLSQHPMPRLL